MPPPALTHDLIGEILLHFPPQEPEHLVRATLVCKRWFRLISDPHFRRRFVNGRAIDARHGRVILNTASYPGFSFTCSGDDLVVWDPITGEHHRLPKLPDHMYPRPYPFCCCWTASVLCAAAGGGCNHLDCHRDPFLVIFVCTSKRETFVSVYSSEAGAWSGPASAPIRRAYVNPAVRSALVGNALFFMSGDCGRSKRILKYVLCTQEISMISLPRNPYSHIALTTMADGGLGFAAVHESKLSLWSSVSGTKGYLRWAQCQAIDLQSLLLPIGTLPTSFDIIYFEDRVTAIFMGPHQAFFTMDLKSLQIKIPEGHVAWPVIPYMSFYTPALGAASTGEGPRDGSSTA